MEKIEKLLGELQAELIGQEMHDVRAYIVEAGAEILRKQGYNVKLVGARGTPRYKAVAFADTADQQERYA